MKPIFLAIHQHTNRQLLYSWLSQHYQVVTSENFDNKDCCLIIIDITTLRRSEAVIAQFRQQQPFIPIILIVSNQEIGLATRQLWKTVDELIVSPVNKIEMLARVHSLIQIEELHVRLQNQNEELLQRSEERYRNLFENNYTVMLIIDPDSGAIVDANCMAANFYGWTQQQLQQMNIVQINQLSTVENAVEMQRAFSAAPSHCFEYQHCRADNSKRDVEVFSGPIPMGGKNLLYAIVNDITERKRIIKELRIADVAFESQESRMVTDANGLIIKINKSFSDTTGYAMHEVVGQTPRLLQSGHHDIYFYQNMWEKILNTGSWQGEIWNRNKDGTESPKLLTISAVKDDDGTITHFIGTHIDITENKLAAKEIERLAFYDQLTELPNRRMLYDRLQLALALAQRSEKRGALLFIDIDNFKILNDTRGHDVGDLLLRQIAQRIESCVRSGDTVARLGGDEFVVMLENLSEQLIEAVIQTKVIGNKILAIVAQPFQLAGHNYHSSCSIGATLLNKQTKAMDELLKQADIAMYQAKTSGRNTLCFFDPKMQATITERAALEKDLYLALQKNQFQLYYQPQVSSENHFIGAEVLIRWLHPERGLVSPTDFIPIMEETGMICSLGRWILEMACAQLKSWEKSVEKVSLQLAVNVSAKQFHQSDFVEQVTKILDNSSIKSDRLKLELTESLVLKDINDSIAKMNELRKVGVRFSMDDFGTGYSSLSYLTQLPLDQLKIDQSFVRNIGVKTADAVIIQTIIGMTKNLGIEVIAEGVETEEQCRFLEQYGCSNYQGYFFGKPISLPEFEQLLTLRRHSIS